MAKFMIKNNKFVFIKLFILFILKKLYLYLRFNIINFLDFIIYKQINKNKIINILKII